MSTFSAGASRIPFIAVGMECSCLSYSSPGPRPGILLSLAVAEAVCGKEGKTTSTRRNANALGCEQVEHELALWRII